MYFPDDPLKEDFRNFFTGSYADITTTGLRAVVFQRGHALLEKTLPEGDFGNVLEVGVGSGDHIFHMDRFSCYTLSDADETMLAMARDRIEESGRFRDREIRTSVQQGERLTFPDGAFDRLVATHVLEHIPEPYKALREWARVVRPGGIISVILPTDPGILWRFSRRIGRGKNEVPYEYWNCREHVNPISHLVTYINHYFEHVDATWWPLRVPSIDCNLLYVAHFRNDEP